ncbi:MAG: hypothetical protein CMP23_14350 [Rickettsiales bacterium]|nr:hypothetical protein [Rickettsiales bacterium]|tara:strand:+ start:9914 stop:11602 length:1689 start_codon:yes stop_codon:yes gene_type:complete
MNSERDSKLWTWPVIALLCAGLQLLPTATAQALPTAQSLGMEAYIPPVEPSLNEVEQAIEQAAQHFEVPAELLSVVAHTESRWRHRPHRSSPDGRRGLFNLSPARLALASDALDESSEHLAVDLELHALAFAWLLHSARPGPDLGLGSWRDSLAWALELQPGAADFLVDRWFALLDGGVIDRLDTGEPVTIAPSPIAAHYLGLFAASAESQSRSPDYPGAAWVPAANCNTPNCPYPRTIGDIDMVVIHTAQGSYNGTISWFQNCDAGVSAHYVVSEGGEITQMVEEEWTGWHISACNGHSIGIEHEGWVQDLWYPDAMYQASAALTSDILTDWNIPIDRNNVIGHDELQAMCNTTHTDPGAGWDWDYYMSLIGGVNTVDLTELVGYVRHTDIYEASYGIANATVTISGHGTTQADPSGYYVFDPIPPGTWEICARAEGYEENCRSKTVEADITNWGSILLAPGSPGDDDDSLGDDDDTSGNDNPADDDDTSGNNDPTDDDDTSDDTTGQPPFSDDEEADSEANQRSRNGCACANASTTSATPLPGLLLLSLVGLAARRKRLR